MSFRVSAIVPSHNHYAAMPAIIARLRALELRVFVIDDASDDAQALMALAAPAVSVHRLEVNQGKGGAVIAGLELAAAEGFTHALQIDADGQHDLAAVPALLAAARGEPGAIVVGAPQYDETMPAARRLGRRITRFWIAIETLKRDLVDTMCGLRIYPLAATMPLLRAERLGKRMDFDPEILVRLLWRGTPAVQIPVRVHYPAGNLSNFRLLRDNLAITRMHARLFFGMLVRLPSLLRRMRGRRPRHWSNLAERGAYAGLRVLAAAYQLLGTRGCLALMAPVVLYFHLTGAAQRRASHKFLERAFAAKGAARRPGSGATLRHSFSFARKALETFAAWTGQAMELAIDDRSTLDQALSNLQGGLIIVSHWGNVELSRALIDPALRSRFTILVHTKNAAHYARLLARFQPDAAIDTIEVSEFDPATIEILRARVASGGWIAIAGDRTPLGGPRRTVRVPFLGALAPFPQGPYILAHVLECPTFLLFCARERGRHRLSFLRFADRISLPRGQRDAALATWAGRFARRLEAVCLIDPFQWYNFFDFWGDR